MSDIIILVADGQQEQLILGLLPRLSTIPITSKFTFLVIRHSQNDPGCFWDSHTMLRPYINQFKYALVLFDIEGCGAGEGATRESVEKTVLLKLENNGWVSRASVVAIEPEVENWLWQDSPSLEGALGWKRSLFDGSLYEWGRKEGKIPANSSKPLRPKETLELALRKAGTPRSGAIYKKVAETVSFKNCIDPSFQKLLQTLKTWFPIE